MNQQNATPTAPRPRRNWRQFSLRTLLVAMAIASVAGAWVSAQLRWKHDRAAARAQQFNLETTYAIIENWSFGSDASPEVDPPTVLQWFGETQGTSAVVLAVDPAEPARYTADRARLAGLFPEAKMYLLGEPGCPVDLVGFTMLAWDAELREERGQQRFAAERHERQALGQRHRQDLNDVSTFDRSTPVTRPDSLGQLLRVERRLQATRLELATTRSAMEQVFDAATRQLQSHEREYERRGAEPAARRGVLACRAEQSRLLEDRAWHDRPAGRRDCDEEEMNNLRSQLISELQWFQKIAALYIVGAKGGEKNLAGMQGRRLSCTAARLAEAEGDHARARWQWLHACQFADLAAENYAMMSDAREDLNWPNILDHCQVLADRAEVKLARLAYLRRTGRLSAVAPSGVPSVATAP